MKAMILFLALLPTLAWASGPVKTPLRYARAKGSIFRSWYKNGELRQVEPREKICDFDKLAPVYGEWQPGETAPQATLATCKTQINGRPAQAQLIAAVQHYAAKGTDPATKTATILLMVYFMDGKGDFYSSQLGEVGSADLNVSSLRLELTSAVNTTPKKIGIFEASIAIDDKP